MESGQPNDKPTAFRMVCVDVSSLELARHATLTERHVAEVGYIRLNAVRPPPDHADPIGFGLGFGADPVFVYESILVGNMPSRVCRMFELRTVYLAGVWAAAMPGFADPAGRRVPSAVTRRERVAARGISYQPRSLTLSMLFGLDLQTLLTVLDGLAAAPDAHLLAVRLSAGSPPGCGSFGVHR